MGCVKDASVSTCMCALCLRDGRIEFLVFVNGWC